MGNYQLCSNLCCQKAEASSISVDFVHKKIKPESSVTVLQTNQKRQMEEPKLDLIVLDPLDEAQELILTLDDQWLAYMQLEDEDINKKRYNIFDIHQITEVALEDKPTNKVICKRVGLNFRRINLIFNQQIPQEGVHFFEVQLLSYIPQRNCQITVGVVDYDQAKHSIQSNQINFQHSYTHLQGNYDLPMKELKNPLPLGKTLKVLISREETAEAEPYITFYLKDQSKKNRKFSADDDNEDDEDDGYQFIKKETLREELRGNKVIVPYIETLFEGLQFSWKVKKPAIGPNQNHLSTIMEEVVGSGVSA